MNPRAYGIFLLVALIVFVLAHGAVVVRVGIVARARRAAGDTSGLVVGMGAPRLALAALVPPFAPFYAWSLGENLFALAWVVTLAVYAVAVGFA